MRRSDQSSLNFLRPIWNHSVNSYYVNVMSPWSVYKFLPSPQSPFSFILINLRQLLFVSCADEAQELEEQRSKWRFAFIYPLSSIMISWLVYRRDKVLAKFQCNRTDKFILFCPTGKFHISKRREFYQWNTSNPIVFPFRGFIIWTNRG